MDGAGNIDSDEAVGMGSEGTAEVENGGVVVEEHGVDAKTASEVAEEEEEEQHGRNDDVESTAEAVESVVDAVVVFAAGAVGMRG